MDGFTRPLLRTLAGVLFVFFEAGCPSGFNEVGQDGAPQADGTVASEGGPQNSPDGTSPPDGASPGDGKANSGRDASAGDGMGDAGCMGLSCDGGCVSNDIRNCGACGHDCTGLSHVMGPGLACDAGACIYACAPGFADCADAGKGCPDDLAQNGNCGSCGITCSGSTPLCSASQCASKCGSALPNLCGSTCRNTQTDPNNCGACGSACSVGTTCDGGQCNCIPCVLDQTNIDQCCLL